MILLILSCMSQSSQAENYTRYINTLHLVTDSPLIAVTLIVGVAMVAIFFRLWCFIKRTQKVIGKCIDWSTLPLFINTFVCSLQNMGFHPLSLDIRKNNNYNIRTEVLSKSRLFKKHSFLIIIQNY